MEILDLFTDVMIPIFKLLTPPERRIAMTVCHKWLDLVNRYFSEDHCLVLTSEWDYSATGSLYRTFSDRSTTHLTFSHLVIKDVNVSRLLQMRNLIELIGDEVKSLKLEYHSSYPKDVKVVGLMLEQILFAKMPNLESFETNCKLILANLSSAINLKRVEFLSGLYFNCIKMEHLNNCRKIKGLESLTASAIQISEKEMGDESLVPFLELHTKVLLSQLMPRNCSIMLEAPTFNFCGEAKLTPDDISGIRIEHFDKPFPSEALSQFKNLKRLQCRYYKDPLVLTKNRVTCSVTEFELCVLESQLPPYLDRLLQSFPVLESLKIRGVCLENEHISVIGHHMPKLKSLAVYLEISLDTVLHSLKDLRFLERLDINTESQCNSGQWPPLPQLKKLYLRGDGFRHLNEDFYSQIAQKSPNITDVMIDYYRGYKVHNFLPLMSQLKLTNLSLFCERDTGYNAELVPNLIKYCKELQEVVVNDPIEFSLSQELQLFSNIPSLMEVIQLDREMEHRRYMTRKDAANLKRYLSKNLSHYKNLRETINYVAKNVIPPNEYQEMCQSFQRICDERERDLYIVTRVFLGMSPESLCEVMHRFMIYTENAEVDMLLEANDYD